MQGRSLYTHASGSEEMPLTPDSHNHYVRCAMPILSEGDIVGCVVSAKALEGDSSDRLAFDIEAKLIQTAANFLGKQLES